MAIFIIHGDPSTPLNAAAAVGAQHQSQLNFQNFLNQSQMQDQLRSNQLERDLARQRMQLAQQQALQQQQEHDQAMALRQQQADDMAAYRQGQLDLGQNRLDASGDLAALHELGQNLRAAGKWNHDLEVLHTRIAAGQASDLDKAVYAAMLQGQRDDAAGQRQQAGIAAQTQRQQTQNDFTAGQHALDRQQRDEMSRQRAQLLQQAMDLRNSAAATRDQNAAARANAAADEAEARAAETAVRAHKAPDEVEAFVDPSVKQRWAAEHDALVIDAQVKRAKAIESKRGLANRQPAAPAAPAVPSAPGDAGQYYNPAGSMAPPVVIRGQEVWNLVAVDESGQPHYALQQ